MKPLLDDWISYYLAYTKETEYPQKYHIWTAISCIAGALQRKTYMPWGSSKIYPNMMVILVGKSGLGKGEAMKSGIEIFKHLKIPVAPESITAQELINFMQNSHKTFTDKDGNKISHSSTQVFAKELSVLMGQNDIRLLAQLTDWYDSDDLWRYETKTQGKFSIEGVCLNLLGGTAPDWIRSMLPAEAVGGGFTSRVIFIYADAKAKIQTRPPEFNDYMADLQRALKQDLKRISNISGQFNFTEDGWQAYEKYYLDQENFIAKGHKIINDNRFDGYVARRALHLRKLSIITAVSRGSVGEVNAIDFNRALDILQSAERYMPTVFGNLGLSLVGSAIVIILDLIQKAGRQGILRSVILSNLYHEIDRVTFDTAERTIISMKKGISITAVGNGDKLYRWTLTEEV